ncbi:hypothetical protein DIPPA_24272 [Diplonema papillatum]|nr:hypothetical protein DIPPA_24272 [Diplonema papillatum]
MTSLPIGNAETFMPQGKKRIGPTGRTDVLGVEATTPSPAYGRRAEAAAAAAAAGDGHQHAFPEGPDPAKHAGKKVGSNRNAHTQWGGGGGGAGRAAEQPPAAAQGQAAQRTDAAGVAKGHAPPGSGRKVVHRNHTTHTPFGFEAPGPHRETARNAAGSPAEHSSPPQQQQYMQQQQQQQLDGNPYSNGASDPPHGQPYSYQGGGPEAGGNVPESESGPFHGAADREHQQQYMHQQQQQQERQQSFLEAAEREAPDPTHAQRLTRSAKEGFLSANLSSSEERPRGKKGHAGTPRSSDFTFAPTGGARPQPGARKQQQQQQQQQYVQPQQQQYLQQQQQPAAANEPSFLSAHLSTSEPTARGKAHIKPAEGSAALQSNRTRYPMLG